MEYQGKKRILFADDEAPIRRLYEMVMETSDYQPIIAENGNNAYHLYEESLKDGGVSLMITDLHMPGGDGVDFAARVRQNHPEDHTIIFALTGWAATAEMQTRCKNSGIDGILFKPISMDRLIALFNDNAGKPREAFHAPA
jgi:CheY-like chemotaxis protein